MELRKVIMNTGFRTHLTADGKLTLCGRPFYREGDDRSRMCANCDRLAKRREIVAEMTREAIASTNPEHPEAQPAPAPGITRVLARELRPGMRIANGYDPDMIVTGTEDAGTETHDGYTASLTRVHYTVNGRSYTDTWGNNPAWNLMPVRTDSIPAPAPVMHYGVSRILCGATLEYVGSDHCKGGDGPCSAACDCGCKMGEFECMCDNATDIVAEVTCEPCKEGLHRPVDAPNTPAPATDPTPAPIEPQTDAWRVVDANTGDTVTLPTTRPDFRGDMGTVTGIAQPPTIGKSGKVIVPDRVGREFYPSVFGLRIVPNN